jgi:hypothetical protein
MTKKDFIVMAATFQRAYNAALSRETRETIDDMVEAYVITAKSRNPRFNEERFRKACGQ